MEQKILLPNNNGFMKFLAKHRPVIHFLDEIAVAFGNVLEGIKQTTVKRRAKLSRSTTLMLLSSACYTEFTEVTALATTGLGSGASKLLRALTERVTTTLYLMKHARQIKRFTDYTAVHDYKLLAEFDKSIRTKKRDIPKERRAEIMERYEAVKRNYQRKPCGKCAEKISTLCADCKDSLKRTLSWTPIPVPDLAKDVSKRLRKAFLNIYSAPMFHLHVSDWSIASLTKQVPDGIPFFQHEDKEWEEAHNSIIWGCVLILYLANGCNRHFRLGLKQECSRIDAALHAIMAELKPKAS